ncbi:HlyD family type I secretion periplasmic adaptor subunit [Jannaschia pagri]|uniref:Membrane fusion protein (MFP) family protein n=1 Tax=Jannaschia pagri TaxID=2829797 RepID=A0ABQ4NQ86_9RHOB|nr:MULTISPECIES: HlyD family type I secretion periplasmic adaptor subunit [unclassified Jannaschia]GIT92564.1 HlyD family type I secretion periplasmic adaptor subunit [Jannaschia sp. AI_61]GIT96576.1 HlyD family type I secretion periplasmic adaptor subunit [Jannaschia sp. AI_62]
MNQMPAKKPIGKVATKPAKPVPPAKQASQTWHARRQLIMGVIGLAVLLGGFGYWAVFANIAGAIISTGQIAVESNRQVVQHPDGGVVSTIHVREGDTVEAGDPLLSLDRTLLQSDAQILLDQLHEITARASRFRAERDGLDEVRFPDDLLAAAEADEEVDDMLRGQVNLFLTRRESYEREAEQLVRRKEQISAQVDGITSQTEALNLQLGFIRQELDAQRSLLDRGLAQAPRVLSLQREEARLLGQVGEFAAAVAELEGRATEIDLEVLKLDTRLREEAISQLRDLQFRQIELEEQYRSIQERLARMELTAPVAGIVYGLSVFAPRSVIRPADPVLFLVPQDRPLVIQTQVDPIHIDQVYPGQPVTLRMPTFDARTTPELFGSVIRVSPDSFTDEVTGMTYYQAEVLPNEGEIERLNGQVMLPGMPVEAYIRTEDRTPLTYLTKPLTDYFNRAFREG